MSESSIEPWNVEQAANILLDAELYTRTIPMLSSSHSLSLDEAYVIQQAVIRKKLEQHPDDRWKGLKAGLTSKAKQKMVGINEPILGQVLYSNIVQGRQLSSEGLTRPRVEPEVAFYFEKEIGSHVVDEKKILAAIGFAFPALEVLDSRFDDYKFRIEDVVADNASTARVVLGDRLFRVYEETLPTLGVSLMINGAVRETGTAAAILGHPFNSALWTVRKWTTLGNSIPAGSIVMTGGITVAVPISKGDTVVGKFEGWGDVHFYVG
jgi:2-oxo-3-hexenedioate decarboxylase